MKSVDLTLSEPSLADVLTLAKEVNVILRTLDDRQFVVAEIDPGNPVSTPWSHDR